MANEAHTHPESQPCSNEEEQPTPTDRDTVSEYKKIALMLLDHARALKRGDREPSWIGMAEVRRRTALLVNKCWSGRIAVPFELSALITHLLCDHHDATNNKGSLYPMWMTAIEEEAKSPPTPDGSPFSASVRSVALAAFGKSGDHRKTIKAWRGEPNYARLVSEKRAFFEFKKALLSGATEKQMQETCNRIEQMHERLPTISSELTPGLRLAGQLPGGYDDVDPQLMLDVLFGT